MTEINLKKKNSSMVKNSILVVSFKKLEKRDNSTIEGNQNFFLSF